MVVKTAEVLSKNLSVAAAGATTGLPGDGEWGRHTDWMVFKYP